MAAKAKAKAKARAKPKAAGRAKPKARPKAAAKAKPKARPKAAAKAKPRVAAKPTAKALDLFQAYGDGQLPSEGGYIVSSFFDATSPYSRYEVVAYSNVKSIVLTADGLVFQTDGNKLFVLSEPPGYAKKHIEPFRRHSTEHIPHRFAELDVLTTRNQTKVMVSKTPVMTYGSFTVLRPAGQNFSFLFYNAPDVLGSLEKFFAATLNKEAGVPKTESEKAARLVIDGVKKFTIWT